MSLSTSSLRNCLSNTSLFKFSVVGLVHYSTGESAVGKSSLVLRFVKGQFHEYQESTIGGKKFFFHSGTLNVLKSKIKKIDKSLSCHR